VRHRPGQPEAARTRAAIVQAAAELIRTGRDV